MTQIDPYYTHQSLSRSDLLDILRSPRYFYLKSIGEKPPFESYSMDLGNKVHMALLEPERYNDTFIVLDGYRLPEALYKELKGRAQWKELEIKDGYQYFEPGTSPETLKNVIQKMEIAYGTKNLILPDEHKLISNLIQNLIDNKVVNSLLTGEIQSEISFFGEINGVEMKCKVDMLKDNIIIDYKTTDDNINPKTFWKAIPSYGYDMQAYIYSELAKQNGIENPQFKFIVQSKTSYQSIVFNCNDILLAEGKRRTHLAIEIFKRCSDLNQWDDFIDEHGNSNNDTEFDLDNYVPDYIKGRYVSI